VQVDDSATRTVEGSGIGLTIAQGLATRLGGSISVRSELGVGTRFEVRLPVAGVPVHAGPGGPAPALDSRAGSSA
jgi:signal transduction histidine kinase